MVFGIACITYGYLYKNARDISAEKPLYTIAAGQLAQEYLSYPQQAGQKYLNATIAVSGRVTSISGSGITLDSVVLCNLSTAVSRDRMNTSVIIKARCIGFDELFGEVRLDQGTIIEY